MKKQSAWGVGGRSCRVCTTPIILVNEPPGYHLGYHLPELPRLNSSWAEGIHFLRGVLGDAGAFVALFVRGTLLHYELTSNIRL